MAVIQRSEPTLLMGADVRPNGAIAKGAANGKDEPASGGAAQPAARALPALAAQRDHGMANDLQPTLSPGRPVTPDPGMGRTDLNLPVPGPSVAAPPWQPPIIGSLAVIFGVVALFKATVVLAPLGLFCALLAAGFRQYGWAAIGAGAAIAALLTSPAFWTLLGLAWLIDWIV